MATELQNISITRISHATLLTPPWWENRSIACFQQAGNVKAAPRSVLLTPPGKRIGEPPPDSAWVGWGGRSAPSEMKGEQDEISP